VSSVPRLAAFPKGFFDALVERRMSVFRWIELAGGLDLDGIELYPRFLDSFESPYLKRIRTDAAARGLAIPMMCHSPDFTRSDPALRREEVERTKDLFRVTAELGGSFCRVLSGQDRPGLEEGEALRWVVDCLWQLVPRARAAGITMAIENHYKDGLWEYPEFAQGQRRYLAILEAVDTPWLKAQYDPSNCIVAGEDPYELLERVLPRVGTMQASDRTLEGGMLRHGVIGEGLNDYDRIFGTLAKAGYGGWVSIEDGEGATEEEGVANLRSSALFLRGKLARHFGGRS
jgi:sugar phosphate isomerase/epimerase